jgi:hypothetical protein
MLTKIARFKIGLRSKRAGGMETYRRFFLVEDGEWRVENGF